MVKHNTTCRPDRLQMALDSRLSAKDETELLAHLDSCATCRHQLETLAADADDWNDVREFLSDEHDPLAITSEHIDDDASTGRHPPLDFLAPTDNPDMLGRIGTYEVQSVVGYGGMAVVLRAYDATLRRNVAIKVLTPQLATSGAARQRFAREAQAAAAVVHEHVVPIHAVAETSGLPYLVMSYVPGQSLQQRIDQEGPLKLAEILRIARQAASGLAAAHAQGLVHRDVKPANILLENDVERVMIADFGLARAADDASLTRSGIIAGTPHYMAPEQAEGRPIDARADLFGLGSVIYAMCTGHPPFRAATAFAVMRRICEHEPRPIRETNPDIPDWLSVLVEKLLAKDPAERFQTADDLAELLEQCLAHLQHPTSVALPESLIRRHASPWRRRMSVGLLAATLTVTAVGTSAYWLPKNTPTANLPSKSTGTQPSPPDVTEMTLAVFDSQVWNAEIEQLAARIDQLGTGFATSVTAEEIMTWAVEIEQIRQRLAELEAGWQRMPDIPPNSTWNDTISTMDVQINQLERQLNDREL